MERILITMIMITFLIGLVSSATALWVNDPNSCPATDAGEFPGQDCTPEQICGESSDIAQCFDTSTITAPSGNVSSTTSYSGSFDGGYILNCFASADASAPFCDNNGALWCDRNSTCQTTQSRNTVCLGTDSGGGFESSLCGSCRSGYNNCDTDNINCEIQNGASCGFATGSYNECIASPGSGIAGNCTSTANLDCNNDDSDNNEETCNGGADGCEITIGGACTVAGIPGTYDSVCSAGAGVCLITAQHHLTGTEALGSSANPNLWSTQFGSGVLANFTRGDLNLSLIINNSACIILSDGTALCDSSDISGGSGAISNIFDQDLNTTNSPVFANVNTTGTFYGLFNWTINALSLNWLFFDGASLSFNQTTFNQNISAEGILLGFNNTFNSTYDEFAYNQTDNIFFYNQTNSPFFYNMSDGAGNLSWNQSFANTLYADIQWNYNQTDTIFFYNMTESPFFYNMSDGVDNSSWNQSFADNRYLEKNTNDSSSQGNSQFIWDNGELVLFPGT